MSFVGVTVPPPPAATAKDILYWVFQLATAILAESMRIGLEAEEFVPVASPDQFVNILLVPLPWSTEPVVKLAYVVVPCPNQPSPTLEPKAELIVR